MQSYWRRHRAIFEYQNLKMSIISQSINHSMDNHEQKVCVLTFLLLLNSHMFASFVFIAFIAISSN